MPKFEQPPSQETTNEKEKKHEEEITPIVEHKEGFDVIRRRKISPELESETKEFLKNLEDKKTEEETKGKKEEEKERSIQEKIRQAQQKKEKGELITQEEAGLLRSEEITEEAKPEEENKPDFVFEKETEPAEKPQKKPWREKKFWKLLGF